MQLYCPTCQATFAGTARCPRCEARLVTPAEAFAAGGERLPEPPELIRPTGTARLAVGCLVALGLYLGLREWAYAALTAALTGGADGELPPGYLAPGTAFTLFLRTVGIATGGLVSGAGRARGWATGAGTGAVCAALFATLDTMNGAPPGTGELVAGAVALGLAAAAGLIGGRVWPAPAGHLVEPEAPARNSSLARMVERDESGSGKRPTKWLRLLIGILVAGGGFAEADAIRAGMKKMAPGILNLGGSSQAATVDAQIGLLAVIAGGVIAGAATGAGLRHGLTAGIATAIAAAAAAVYQLEQTEMPVNGLLEFLGFSPSKISPWNTAQFTLYTVFALTVFGGWFGGQLFPPVVPKHLRRRRSLEVA